MLGYVKLNIKLTLRESGGVVLIFKIYYSQKINITTTTNFFIFNFFLRACAYACTCVFCCCYYYLLFFSKDLFSIYLEY